MVEDGCLLMMIFIVFMECSGCKEQVLIKDVEKYCPNCGAKLEGVGD